MKKVVEKRYAIVSGDTSGIGREITLSLLAKGYFVYGISRRSESNIEHNNYKHISLDITDSNAVKENLQAVLKEHDIDLLINCAGFGISGAIEFNDIESVKKQMDVNFFGMVNVNETLIPHFRNRRKGRIVNISSVAAIAPIPYQAYYSASKSAMNTYSLALANELRDFDIKVIAIQPGDIKTGFTEHREKEIKGNDIYLGHIEKAVSQMEKDEENGMPAKLAAKKILKIVSKRNPKPLVTIGFGYKCLSLLIKILPIRLVNWIIYKLY